MSTQNLNDSRQPKHGEHVYGTIMNHLVPGRISICSGIVFLCQDEYVGGSAPGMDRFGYRYSWNMGYENESLNYCITYIEQEDTTIQEITLIARQYCSSEEDVDLFINAFTKGVEYAKNNNKT